MRASLLCPRARETAPRAPRRAVFAHINPPGKQGGGGFSWQQQQHGDHKGGWGGLQSALQSLSNMASGASSSSAKIEQVSVKCACDYAHTSLIRPATHRKEWGLPRLARANAARRRPAAAAAAKNNAPLTHTQHHNYSTKDFSGTWNKDLAASDSLDDALRLMQLGGIMRQAVKLVRGVSIEQSSEEFVFRVFSVLTWFKVDVRWELFECACVCCGVVALRAHSKKNGANQICSHSHPPAKNKKIN